MKKITLILTVILSLSGCSLLSDEITEVKELNKQYARVVKAEKSLSAASAKKVALVGLQVSTSAKIIEVNSRIKELEENLAVERQKLEDLVSYSNEENK